MRPGELVFGYPPEHRSTIVLPIAVEELGGGTQHVTGLRRTTLIGSSDHWVLRTWITESELWKEHDAC